MACMHFVTINFRVNCNVPSKDQIEQFINDLIEKYYQLNLTTAHH